MRGVLWAASALVFIAGVQTFVLSEGTERFFSWTVLPPLTAAFIGAGYWSSFILELMAARERVWANARPAFVSALLFTGLTSAATLLHADRFHLNSSDPVTLIATWAWFAVYLGVPFLFVAALIVQARTRGADPPRQRPMPGWVLVASLLQAVVLLTVAVALFAAPATSAILWPWPLTPLTARAVAAWLVGIGSMNALVVVERDYARLRAALASYVLLGPLEVIALARYAGTFRWGSPAGVVYVVLLAMILAVGVYTFLAGVQPLSRVKDAQPAVQLGR
jgi:hypothetical protein